MDCEVVVSRYKWFGEGIEWTATKPTKDAACRAVVRQGINKIVSKKRIHHVWIM